MLTFTCAAPELTEHVSATKGIESIVGMGLTVITTTSEPVQPKIEVTITV